MHIPPELLPVVQITLPLILTIFGSLWIGTVIQNKRFDDLRGDMNRQFDQVIKRLERIETKLETHGERIATLEGRANPPLLRR